MNETRSDSSLACGRASADQGAREQGSKGADQGDDNLNPSSSEAKGSVTAGATPEPADQRWHIGIRIVGGVVTVLGFTPEPVTAVLRKRPWASLIKGHGWTFPERYLAHVERLLDGAGVDLFDIDGFPTPRQEALNRAKERAATHHLIAEIRAAKAAVNADPERTDRERLATRAAFRAAIAAKHPERDETEARTA